MVEEVSVGGMPTSWRFIEMISDATLRAGEIVTARFRFVP
jgi:hypothetical protein